MATPGNLNEVLEKLYTALSSADVETWISLHSQDVAFNVNGATPVSGRTCGASNMLEELLPILFSRLQPGKAEIGVNWKLMCSDENRATVIFEGRATTLEGKEYNNRYVQILEFDDDELICEVWEFFDSALAENVLFTADQVAPAGTQPFRY
jgi:ketosteroid isomerase-like protein